MYKLIKNFYLSLKRGIQKIKIENKQDEVTNEHIKLKLWQT